MKRMRFAILGAEGVLLDERPNKVKAILQARFHQNRHPNDTICIFDRLAREGEINLWILLDKGLLAVGRNKGSKTVGTLIT